MDNLNIDENTIGKLKDMLNNGNVADIMSQIPPDVVNNISSLMNNKSSDNSNISNNSSENNSHKNNDNLHTDSSTANTINNFDFSKIDMNTILKMKNVVDKLNSNNDPRSNLLYSLKPYLREERKNKLDQYANLLNVAKVAELLKTDSTDTNNKNNLKR